MPPDRQAPRLAAICYPALLMMALAKCAQHCLRPRSPSKARIYFRFHSVPTNRKYMTAPAFNNTPIAIRQSITTATQQDVICTSAREVIRIALAYIYPEP
jgi:hypothetical protein